MQTDNTVLFLGGQSVVFCPIWMRIAYCSSEAMRIIPLIQYPSTLKSSQPL